MPSGVYVRTQETKDKMRQNSLEQFKNGMPQETKDKIRKASSEKLGERSSRWRGELAGKSAIHMWIRKTFGKASEHLCVDCGKQAMDWSNIDHSYKRKIEDYSPRCRSCHRKYDIKFNDYHILTRTPTLTFNITV